MDTFLLSLLGGYGLSANQHESSFCHWFLPSVHSQHSQHSAFCFLLAFHEVSLVAMAQEVPVQIGKGHLLVQYRAKIVCFTHVKRAAAPAQNKSNQKSNRNFISPSAFEQQALYQDKQ